MSALERVDKFIPLAEETAKLSECLRRKYGVVIVNKDEVVVTGANTRVTRCCSDKECCRNLYKIHHGQNTEFGAEVHAEQAALINWIKTEPVSDWSFIIAGFSGDGNKLYGPQLYPCYVCARMIKYAGFKIIYLQREGDNVVIPVTIDHIIEHREKEWNDVVDN